jgi:ubiquinone/menaquinone biosynthesis C-methylase UbiE
MGKKDGVEKFFDSYASDFNAIYGHSNSRPWFDRWIDQRFRQSMRVRFEKTIELTKNPDIDTILDIGCGPGHYCIAFLKQGKRVIGLDVSVDMLNMAQSQINTLGLSKNFTVVKSDYMAYLPNESVDAACLIGFFDYISDAKVLLEKLKKDVREEFYASFPCDTGVMALQRKIRYKFRGVKIHYYSISKIKYLMESVNISTYKVFQLGRDLFVHAKIN